jgi:hypothetical protein
MLYRQEPDGLGVDLARYRAVTSASIQAAIARWLAPAHQIEVETAATAPAGAPAAVTDPASAP